MNPLLSRLQPYPFERLRKLQAGVTPSAQHRPISLGIGEPRHAAPDFLKQALADDMDGIVDTTGAGDGFNAGYLAARVAGRDAASCVASVTKFSEQRVFTSANALARFTESGRKEKRVADTNRPAKTKEREKRSLLSDKALFKPTI